MPLPLWSDGKLMLAMLRELSAAGGQARPEQLYASLRQYFPEITDEDLVSAHASGDAKWPNTVRWTRQHLVNRGFIDGSVRGTWTITTSGTEWMNRHWMGPSADYSGLKLPPVPSVKAGEVGGAQAGPTAADPPEVPEPGGWLPPRLIPQTLDISSGNEDILQVRRVPARHRVAHADSSLPSAEPAPLGELSPEESGHHSPEPDPTETLIQRLRASQRLSGQSRQFELDLTEAFEVLGFSCRHIGGSGATDILLRAPLMHSAYSVVVDAKTSQAGRVSQGRIDVAVITSTTTRHRSRRVLRSSSTARLVERRPSMAAGSEPLIDVSADEPTLHGLTAPDVAALADELVAYHARFAPHFARREQREWAAVYLRGLLVADVPRKNTEAMALRLLGAGDGAEARVRALQQFIGEGGWDDDILLAEHRRLVDETLGEADGVLIVDESAVPKRGEHSAGVARQWCGARGKQENCQVGVFLGYASRRGYTLLDRRLYLPQEWFDADHRARWEACRIPDETAFASKADLAGRMMEAAVAAGLRARWLTCDEWYGRDSAFLDRVASAGLWYLAEVGKSTMLWPLADPATGAAQARPQTWVPPRNASGKGRVPVRVRLQPDSPPPLRVDELVARLADDRWQRCRILEGARGPLVADFAALRAVAVRGGLPGPDVWLVLRRSLPEPGGQPEMKFYLSNVPADTPLAALVRVSGLRWPIESCFEEGKAEVGLDQYELRFWRGWQHHTTMVILAHHFLVRLSQRLDQRGGAAPAAGRRADGGRSGLPRRSAHRRPAPGAPTGPAPHPDAAASALAAPRGLAPTGPHADVGAGPRGVLAASQPRRLPVPSPAHAPAAHGARPVAHVSLSY